MLPNSGLAKATLTNLSSPNRSHGVKIRVRILPTMAPSADGNGYYLVGADGAIYAFGDATFLGRVVG